MFESDRAFHKKKWAQQAKAHERRGGLERWVSRDNTSKTADDVMREEADRDNADFDKRHAANERGVVEYEEWEKSAAIVRANFLERAHHPERTDIKTVLVFLQGGMKAANIAGAALALDMMGITSETVDETVGVSSGDVVATRFVGGREQLLRGIAMLIGPLATKKFIDVFRLGNAINLEFLKSLEDEGEFAVDTDAVREAHSGLWTIVTEPIKGGAPARAVLLDKKEMEEGITTGTTATMTIPKVTGKLPTIGGVSYYDGGFAALPIRDIVERFKPENPHAKLNILIFSQASFELLDDIRPSGTEEMAKKILGSVGKAPRGVGSLDAASINQLSHGMVLKEQQRQTLEAIQKETGAQIGVQFAPPNNLSMTSIDALEMESAILDSFRRTFDAFGVEQPEEMPAYVSELEKRRLTQAIERYTASKAA